MKTVIVHRGDIYYADLSPEMCIRDRIRATTIFNAKGKDWLKSTIAAKKSAKIAPDKMRCFIATSLYRYFLFAKNTNLLRQIR